MDVENPKTRSDESVKQATGEKRMKTYQLVWIHLAKARDFPKRAVKALWKLGQDDPRRAVHALKVGISLTLVSLLYLLKPLFKVQDFGENAIWAVMTVVVVFEFTAGATLCKGLNRGLGTFLAGSLAFLFEYISTESGQVLRAVFIGCSVFFVGAAATYMRFIPQIKKKCDYGVVIFLITFNLIMASSYRADNVVKIACERFYTIAIGCGICLLMSLLVFPNWSDEALHDSIVLKFESLAKFIEACVNVYFRDSAIEPKLDESLEDSIYEGYKAVLDSKTTDEMLAMHASWEPRHSRHRFPSQQYVKIGAILRHFGYTVVALHGCLQTEIQAPLRVRARFKGPCTKLAGKISKVLMELAQSIRNRRHCSPELLCDHLQQALHDLNMAIRSQPRLFLGSNSHHHSMPTFSSATTKQEKEQPHAISLPVPSDQVDSSVPVEHKAKKGHAKENEAKVLRKQLSKLASFEFSEALPFAAFASLLVELAAKLDEVIEEVEELGRVGKFKQSTASDELFISCEQPKLESAIGNPSASGE